MEIGFEGESKGYKSYEGRAHLHFLFSVNDSIKSLWHQWPIFRVK